MESHPSRFRPLFLIGEYDAVLDDKSRLLIPSDFRKEIFDARDEKSLICRIGINRVAWLYPENYYRELISQRQMPAMPAKDDEAFNEASYGMVFRLAWDAQGRVVVPEKMIRRAKLQREICIVGAGDHLVIRNRAAWEARVETLLGMIDEMAEKKDKAKSDTPAEKPAEQQTSAGQ